MSVLIDMALGLGIGVFLGAPAYLFILKPACKTIGFPKWVYENHPREVKYECQYQPRIEAAESIIDTVHSEIISRSYAGKAC